jgi:uncharacterized protein YecA (UPF0149 family)
MHYKNASKLENLLDRVPIPKENKVGRNDPCPYGSGKIYK